MIKYELGYDEYNNSFYVYYLEEGFNIKKIFISKNYDEALEVVNRKNLAYTGLMLNDPI